MANENFFSLQGQVAVVTGAGQGIGEGIATRLGQAGARVAILDTNRAAAEEVAGRLKGVGLLCDVSSASSVQQAIEEVQRQLGPIQILVNNAGITGRTLPLWELEESDLDQVYAVNLKGVFLMCRAVIPGMLAQGYGRILNVASIAGKEGNPTLIPYSSTKAAVIGLTKALAKEVAGKGNITVNAISPAVIRTKILDTHRQGNRAIHGEPHPHGPHGDHRRNRRAGTLPGFAGGVVHHRPVLRHFRRKSDVLMGFVAPAAP